MKEKEYRIILKDNIGGETAVNLKGNSKLHAIHEEGYRMGFRQAHGLVEQWALHQRLIRQGECPVAVGTICTITDVVDPEDDRRKYMEKLAMNIKYGYCDLHEYTVIIIYRSDTTYCNKASYSLTAKDEIEATVNVVEKLKNSENNVVIKSIKVIQK